MNRGVTPSQTIGPFFHHALPWDSGGIVAADDSAGERIEVTGRVFDGAGEPVPDALVEIWQADAAGVYRHPEDGRESTDGFLGFGRCPTDKDGIFRFVTIKPGRVPGRGNSLQAPHISVTVFTRGLLRHLNTRMYFADEAAANAEDPVLALLENESQRSGLIAQRGERDGRVSYSWEIRLQGDGETVFFEL